ncbi:DUF5050 domain-containing protein [Candidatus Peregrinibacteria bacterium]|nr:DUF5050 domain-containing protein [Candidatus Peregrinibacteria bacterium]
MKFTKITLLTISLLSVNFLFTAEVGFAQPANYNKIVFTSDQGGDNEIYSMNKDGTERTQLTNNTYYDALLDVSPDGTKILFTNSSLGNYEIFQMDIDGSNVVNLTNNSANDWNFNTAVYSPDGSKVYFVTDRTGNDEIFSMNSDGTNPVNLTNNSADDTRIALSPDGSEIFFITRRVSFSNPEVFKMNSDGSNPVNISNDTLINGDPALSNDGTKVVFNSRTGTNTDIFVANSSDGSGRLQLTNRPNLCDFGGVFDPNDNNIIFTRCESGGAFDVYSIGVDGSNLTPLADGSGNQQLAKFSPDNAYIYYSGQVSGDDQIFRMNTDGTNKTNLSNSSYNDRGANFGFDSSIVAGCSGTGAPGEVCSEVEVTCPSVTTGPIVSVTPTINFETVSYGAAVLDNPIAAGQAFVINVIDDRGYNISSGEQCGSGFDIVVQATNGQYFTSATGNNDNVLEVGGGVDNEISWQPVSWLDSALNGGLIEVVAGDSLTGVDSSNITEQMTATESFVYDSISNTFNLITLLSIQESFSGEISITFETDDINVDVPENTPVDVYSKEILITYS